MSDSRRLLDNWEVLEEKHLDSGGALRGTLKVVAPVALGQLHLMAIALKFQQQNPLLTLSWQLEDSNLHFVEVGCDCWIKVGPILDESLQTEQLGQAERIIVAAPTFLQAQGMPKTPADLEKLPCVALEPFEGGHIPLTCLVAGRKEKTVSISPPVKMSTNNIFALRQAVLAGLGFAVMPRWFVAQTLESGMLVDFFPAWKAPMLTIYAASLPERHQPRRLHEFIEMLRVEVPLISGIESERKQSGITVA